MIDKRIVNTSLSLTGGGKTQIRNWHQNRNETIDGLKGLGILLMVLGHCSIPYPLYRLIYLFHMPLFFFVSGYLFKKREWQEFFTKRYHSLIIPLIVSLVIATPFAIYHDGWYWILNVAVQKNDVSILGHNWGGNIGPFWFIFALFGSSIMLNAILVIKPRIGKLLCVIGFFELSLLFYKFFDTSLPFQLCQISGSLLCMYVGYELKQIGINDFTSKFLIKILILLATGLVLWKGQLHMSRFVYNLNILLFIGAMGLVGLLVMFVQKVNPKWIAVLGYYSLPIFCLHSIDRFMGLSRYTFLYASQITLLSNFVIEYVLKIFAIIVLWVVLYRIPIIRRSLNLHDLSQFKYY